MSEPGKIIPVTRALKVQIVLSFDPVSNGLDLKVSPETVHPLDILQMLFGACQAVLAMTYNQTKAQQATGGEKTNGS